MKPNWLQVKWIVQTILIDLILTPKVAPSSPAGYRLYIQGLDNKTGDKTDMPSTEKSHLMKIVCF